MRFKFLFGMFMFSLLLYGCKSKVTKLLDRFEAEISKAEDLYRRAENGSITFEDCVEEFADISIRLYSLAEEGERLSDDDLTEKEAVRMVQLGLRFEKILKKFE